MTTLTRRDSRGPHELFEWPEIPWAMMRPVGGHPVRVEDYVQDGHYVLRAERHEDSHNKHHSEFLYGSFARSVTLPATADDTTIEALYDNGILEITVALAANADDKVSRTIPVRLNQHIKPD